MAAISQHAISHGRDGDEPIYSVAVEASSIISRGRTEAIALVYEAKPHPSV